MHVVLESIMKSTVFDEDHKGMYQYLLVAFNYQINFSFLKLTQYDCSFCAAIFLMASVSSICYMYYHNSL